MEHGGLAEGRCWEEGGGEWTPGRGRHPPHAPGPPCCHSPFGMYFFGLCCQSLSGPGNASVTTTPVGVPDRRDRSGEIWG